jgi:hypothetical protein
LESSSDEGDSIALESGKGRKRKQGGVEGCCTCS